MRSNKAEAQAGDDVLVAGRGQRRLQGSIAAVVVRVGPREVVEVVERGERVAFDLAHVDDAALFGGPLHRPPHSSAPGTRGVQVAAGARSTQTASSTPSASKQIGIRGGDWNSIARRMIS